MSQDDESFRDLNFWQKLLVVVSLALIVVFVLAFVFGGYFFGLTGFFALIGVHYDSIGSLLLFALFVFLLGILFEVVEGIILLYISISKLLSWQRFLLTGIVKIGLLWFVIHTVDEFMDSITLSWFAELLTAFLEYCVDVAFNDKSKGKDENQRMEN